MPTDTADVALAKAMRAQLDPGSVDVFGLLRYKPTAKQLEFHAAEEFDVVFGGSRGSGKSVAVLLDGIRRCVHHPGLRALALRRTYPELKSTLLAELARYGFARRLGCTWNGTDYELRFPNGSLLKFGYLDALADTAKYQGTSWGLLCIDELTLMLPAAVEILRETLRSGDEGRSVIGVRASCNPGGPGHTAIKTEYVDATNYGEDVLTDEFGRTKRYIPARVTDNPHVGKAYVRQLEAIPDPARRKTMLDGDWSAFGGQVFSEWSRFRHVVPRDLFELPAAWQRFAAVDYGFAAPWAVLWGAKDNDGRWWIYRELYDKGVSPTEQAQRILAAEAEAGEHDVVHFIDPSTVAKATGGLSIHEMYGQAGLGCALATNDRLPGWQTVHSYLADGPLCPYHSFLADRGEWSGASCPMLHVLDGAAPNLVRTLPDLPYDTVRVEDVDTKVEDHAADSLRYLLHSTGSTARPMFHDAFDRPAHLETGYSVPPPPSSTVQASPFV